MNILIIPDSFKDSISSKEIIISLTEGFKAIVENITIYSCVGSDGGEGFLDAVSHSMSVEVKICETVDPLGRKIRAKYLIDENSKCAYIELAQASGLELLKWNERNPMKTSTTGTGLQILQAIHLGAEKIVIGLGGSATTDAGLGIVREMGYVFKDNLGTTINPCGENLLKIKKISGVNEHNDIEFIVINDVVNPLYGKNGAAYVYSSQKGANLSEIKYLDEGLRHLSLLSKKLGFEDFSKEKGGGAAGGVAFGLMTFLNAKSISGVEFLFQISDIEKILENEAIDFIITGEGSLDSQSLQGKLISGVCKLGKKHKIPVIAICGRLGLEPKEYKGLLFSCTIAPPDLSPEESIKNAKFYIKKLPKKLLQIMKEHQASNQLS